jgi:hypothetical protein
MPSLLSHETAAGAKLAQHGLGGGSDDESDNESKQRPKTLYAQYIGKIGDYERAYFSDEKCHEDYIAQAVSKPAA